MKYSVCIIFLVLGFGCAVEQTTQTNTDTYFDINQYFKSEVTRLTKDSIGVFKRTRMDSTTNSDSVFQPDWSKELFAFLDVTIKPTVWKTDFTKIDTHDDPNETAAVYKTTNPNQKIKSFKLKFNPDSSVQRFSAEIIDKGKIATSVTGISYTQNVGYTIKVDRSTKIIGDESYQIVGQFFNTTQKNN